MAHPRNRVKRRWVLVAVIAGLAFAGGGDSAEEPVDPEFPFTYTQPEGFKDASDVNIDTQVVPIRSTPRRSPRYSRTSSSSRPTTFCRA